MNNQCVYTHVHPENKIVFYVGMGIIKRAYDFKNRNRFWKRTVLKFGAPEVNIIAQNLEPEKAAELEKFLIKYFGLNNLTNISPGGDNITGFVHSDESRKRISLANKGKKRSLETRKRISEGRKGIVFSQEHRKNISLAQSGEKHKNWGKKFSSETKDKMKVAATGKNSANADKTIYRFSHVQYGSITCLQCELRRLFGLDQAALRRVVIGQQKQHKGWAVVK